MLVLCARTVLGAAGGCIPMNKIGGDVWPCGACVVSFDFHLYLERDFSVGHVDHGPFLWSDCVCLSLVFFVPLFGSDADLEMFCSCFISLMFPVLNVMNECFRAS